MCNECEECVNNIKDIDLVKHTCQVVIKCRSFQWYVPKTTAGFVKLVWIVSKVQKQRKILLNLETRVEQLIVRKNEETSTQEGKPTDLEMNLLPSNIEEREGKTSVGIAVKMLILYNTK